MSRCDLHPFQPRFPGQPTPAFCPACNAEKVAEFDKRAGRDERDLAAERRRTIKPRLTDYPWRTPW